MKRLSPNGEWHNSAVSDAARGKRLCPYLASSHYSHSPVLGLRLSLVPAHRQTNGLGVRQQSFFLRGLYAVYANPNAGTQQTPHSAIDPITAATKQSHRGWRA
jgi:hypothetical protein